MAKRNLSRRFLPPDPRATEPYRLTPQLALRVGILGMLALAVFATLFLRLWSLQILNGEQLLRASQNNQRRDIRVQAPRGPILDRNGDVLVTNIPGRAVQICLRLSCGHTRFQPRQHTQEIVRDWGVEPPGYSYLG